MTDDMVVRAAIRDELSSGLQHIQRELKATGTAVDRTSGAAKRSASSWDKASSGIGRMAKMAGRAGLLAGGALATIGGAAAAVGIKTAAGMENARISFSTMLGSAKKADAFLKNLAAFAAKTPFEFPELQTAASSLISAGIHANKVIPIMTTLGDVTSGMGTGSEGVKRATVALQQMSAAGRITGEDLNQLRDAGVPVYDLLAKATGKSKAEVVALAQAGKLGKKELGQMMKALETGKGLERFTGLMEKQSASLSGQWSTLKDTFSMGMASAIQPLIPLIKDGLAVASEKLAIWIPKAAAGLKSFIEGFKAGTGPGGQLKAVLEAVWGVIQPIGAWMLNNKTVVATFAGTLLVLAAAMAIVNAVMALNPFVLVAIALAALAAGLVYAYKKSETFRNIVNSALQATGKVAAWLWNNAFAPALRMIVVGFGWVMTGIGKFLVALGKIPGFGWATEAGKKMQAAGADARDLAKSIKDIPTKKRIDILTVYTKKNAASNRGPAGVTGDTATSRSHGRGNIGSTLAAHYAASAATGARPTITNAFVGGGGRGPGSGDHQAGRALDLQGKGLAKYGRYIRAAGGFAEFHGSGSGRHLHAVPAAGDTSTSRARPNARRSGSSGGGVYIEAGAIIVHAEGAASDVDVEQAVANGIRSYIREREERA